MVNLDLLRLRSATTAYLEILEAVTPTLEQIADVNAVIEPRYRRLLDEVRSAWLLTQHRGTPAAIGRVLAELLG